MESKLTLLFAPLIQYELESAEMLRKSGQELTPELWLAKILLGGIDGKRAIGRYSGVGHALTLPCAIPDSYDEKDES